MTNSNRRHPRPDKAMQAAIGSGFYQAMQDKAEQDNAHHYCGRCHKARASVTGAGELCALCKLARRTDNREKIGPDEQQPEIA